MAIKPIGDKILVELPKEEEIKVGSLYVPDTAKEKPQQARVVAVGEGRRNDSNQLVPMSVKVGDVVVYRKYGGMEINHEGKDYLILSEGDILAVIA